ncbi:MAG: hypothetical protein DRP11_05300 [Candidatus Aenigmatarchaeota archaeon]|nr:MAG: hypothetical protein DRP11_05300 [Candidatus Aenigmarchaeota archaeon]
MRIQFLILALVAIAGCTQPGNVDVAKEECIKLCQEALARGENLENGPCLSNRVIEGWVCDVAHSPRQDVDNRPENQCPEFGKSASHFVEVDPNCRFIRSY